MGTRKNAARRRRSTLSIYGWLALGILGLGGSLGLRALGRTLPGRPVEMMGDGGGSDGGGTLYPNEDERAKAARYNRTREWLTLVGTVWTGLLSLLALATGLSARLRDQSARVAPRRLGPTMPYMLGATLLSTLFSLPLSYY